MPRVLLLHTNKSYADMLAAALDGLATGYETTVISRTPLRERLSHLALSEYDLIQADECMTNGLLSAVGGSVTGTPLVITLRGWADYCNAHGQHGPIRAFVTQELTRQVLGRASAVGCISSTTREMIMEKYDVDPVVTGRPIDTTHYASGNPISGWSTTMDILTVTNLRYAEKYAGIIRILEALAPLFERFPALRYRVAGDGQHLSSLKDRLAEYPHSDRVDLLGHRSDVPDLLASADLFVYFSGLDSYATSVLEAQAAGLPVIGGGSGVPETIGEAGVICEPESSTVRGAIERALSDDGYREELGANSRSKMTTHNENSALKHAMLWNRVLNRGERDAPTASGITVDEETH